MTRLCSLKDAVESIASSYASSSSAAKVPVLKYQRWRLPTEMQNIHAGGPDSLNFWHNLEKQSNPIMPKPN